MAITDIAFSDLYGYVLTELKEPSTGSNAIPLATVKNKINETYYEVFNAPWNLAYYREKSYEFTTIVDTTTSASVVAGAVSLSATDSSLFGSSGKLLIEGTDIVTFSANAANVFTVTGVSNAHDSGVTIQNLYALPTDIDEQETHYLNINGFPYKYVSYTDYFSRLKFYSYIYTIFDSRLYLPMGQTALNGILTYSQALTLLSADSDKPTFIPNKFRIPLLVYGTVAKLAARDDLRTGWDWYEQQYQKALGLFYAMGNNRIQSKKSGNRGSVYD